MLTRNIYGMYSIYSYYITYFKFKVYKGVIMLNSKYHSTKLVYFSILGIIANFIIASVLIYANLVNIKVSFYSVIFLSIILLISVILQITLILKVYSFMNETKEKEELFEQILESLPNAILVHRKLKFIYANNLAVGFLNKQRAEDIINRKVEDFVKLNVDVIGEERLENALKEVEFQPLIEDKIIMRNGDALELEVFSKPIFIKEKTAVLNVFRDITEQKRIDDLKGKIEEEKRKLREAMEMEKLKNEFFANLSHEFRTPLTIILGMIQLIEKDIKNTPQIEILMKKRLKVLKQNCFRLLKLIGNLIDMTKIDAGYFMVTLKNHDIVAIIENTTLSVVEYAENKGISVEFDTEVEEKITACDEDKIERIMLNLLSNAVKFTDEGGSIKVKVFDDDKNIRFIVKDTGIGIPDNMIDTIFNRFVQVDKSFTRNHEGSGIGLSLVKAFVEMHNGSIMVQSKYGEGSTFIITLPIKILPEEGQPAENSNLGENNKQKVNIEFSDMN